MLTIYISSGLDLTTPKLVPTVYTTPYNKSTSLDNTLRLATNIVKVEISKRHAQALFLAANNSNSAPVAASGAARSSPLSHYAWKTFQQALATLLDHRDVLGGDMVNAHPHPHRIVSAGARIGDSFAAWPGALTGDLKRNDPKLFDPIDTEMQAWQHGDIHPQLHHDAPATGVPFAPPPPGAIPFGPF